MQRLGSMQEEHWAGDRYSQSYSQPGYLAWEYWRDPEELFIEVLNTSLEWSEHVLRTGRYPEYVGNMHWPLLIPEHRCPL